MKVLFIQNNGIQESIGIANLSGTLKARAPDRPAARLAYARTDTKSDYLRRKSVARAVAEIKYIKDRYRLNHAHFSDDLFFIRNSYK